MKPKTKILTATSFSRYKLHAECPQAARFKFIDKYPEPPPGPALVRGGFIHKGIQAYIEGRRPKLPEDDGTDYGELEATYAMLRKKKAACEIELAVNEDWEPVEWMASDVWFRAKLDAALFTPKSKLLDLFDHKTGRQKPADHTEQLEQYVAVAPARWPDALGATAAMLYVDHGREMTAVHPDLSIAAAVLRKKWAKRFQPLLRDRTWRATPGDHCTWCPFSGRKGGPCKAG